MYNSYADVSSEARGMDIGLNFHLYPYFVCAGSKALASLRPVSSESKCADASKPSLLTDAISTEISCTGSVLG